MNFNEVNLVELWMPTYSIDKSYFFRKLYKLFKLTLTSFRDGIKVLLQKISVMRLTQFQISLYITSVWVVTKVDGLLILR